MDPYSSPYIIADNGPQNPFPTKHQGDSPEGSGPKPKTLTPKLFQPRKIGRAFCKQVFAMAGDGISDFSRSMLSGRRSRCLMTWQARGSDVGELLHGGGGS